MIKGGLIIRLIDVVLILLLGFIGISDFTIKTQIKLPQGTNEHNTLIRKRYVIYIRIDNKGRFEVDDGENKIANITELYHVEQEVKRLQQKRSDLVVVIEPHLDTIIQITVDLIDICEKYHIPKTISYEL